MRENLRTAVHRPKPEIRSLRPFVSKPEAFIAKELQTYLRIFPTDFYQEMFRLRDLHYPSADVQRPYFGILTNDIVYDRLARGVLDELKKVNPKDESGRRSRKHFQWLTRNIGYPKL